MLNGIKSNLERGRSIEYVISDLTADGLDRDIAANMVTMVIGNNRAVSHVHTTCSQFDNAYI